MKEVLPKNISILFSTEVNFEHRMVKNSMKINYKHSCHRLIFPSGMVKNHF
jgi:hypothetical protein